MNKRNFHRVFYFLIVLSLSSASFAQEKPSSVSKGVLNGSASNLVKPAYPAAAKAARASGAVNVQVTIDENGDVISAEAVSGHPLLRAAAVDAAKASKFLPTVLSGQPVKVTGIIVYNFTTALSLLQIGFELARARTDSDFGDNFRANSLNGSIPADWTNEKQLSQSLVNKQQWEQKQKSARASADSESSPGPLVSTSSAQQSPQKDSKTRMGVTTIVGERNMNPASGSYDVQVKESFENIIDSLTNSIKTRFSNDETKSWTFSLGITAGNIYAHLKDENKLRQHLNELKQLALSHPQNIKQSFLDELKQISVLADDNNLDAADKEKIESFVAKLR